MYEKKYLVVQRIKLLIAGGLEGLKKFVIGLQKYLIVVNHIILQLGKEIKVVNHLHYYYFLLLQNEWKIYFD